MMLVEFVKNGVTKFTVAHLADHLERLGWERVGAKRETPQVVSSEESSKPKRTRKPREAK